MEKSQVRTGLVISFVTVILTNVIGLIYMPIMLRFMGQSEYGLYSLVASIIGYLTILDLGFGNAIIVFTSKYRSLGRYDDEKKLHGMFLIIYTVIGIVASIIGLVLYFNVNNMFGNTLNHVELQKAKILMLILTVNLILTFPLSIFSAIITAYEKFIIGKLSNLIRILLNPIIMIALLFMGYRSVAMALVTTVLNLGVLTSYAIYCNMKLNIKIEFHGFDFKLLGEVFSYSFFIFLAVIVDKVNWSVDHFILGATVGTVMVAIFAVASQINTIYLSFSTAISNILLPKISKMVANNSDDEKLSNEFIKTGRIQYMIMALILTGFVIFGKDFILFWAGKDYLMAYYVVLLLIVPSTIPLIQNTGINILQAKNKVKFISLINILIAIFNVLVSIPLSKMYGAVGAATGTAISIFIGNVVIMNIYYKNKVNIDIYRFYKNIIKITIPILIIAIPSYFIYNYLQIDLIIKLILGAIIFLIIYMLTITKFAMNDYEKEIAVKPFKNIHKMIYNKKDKKRDEENEK